MAMQARARVVWGGIVWGGVVLAAAAASSWAQCQPVWQTGFQTAGISSTLSRSAHGLSAAMWDNGAGMSVYVGGEISSIGNLLPVGGQQGGVGNIAQWDGTTWTKLGSGVGQGEPSGGRVYAILGHTLTDEFGVDTGLYVGGGFQRASGVTVNNIARWDGSQWSPLGSGFAYRSGNLYGPHIAQVREIKSARFDPQHGYASDVLIAQGEISAIVDPAGDRAVPGVAIWNGIDWASPGTLTSPTGPLPTSAPARCIDVIDSDGAGPAFDELYVGGSFTTAGGVAITGGLARFDGANWHNVPGISGSVLNIQHTFENGLPVIFISGNITINGVTSQIARFRGGVWELVPGILAGKLLGADDAHVYAQVSIENVGQLLARIPASSLNYQIIQDGPNTAFVGEDTGIYRCVPVDFDLSGPGGTKVLCLGRFSRIASTVAINMGLVNGLSVETVLQDGLPGGFWLPFGGLPAQSIDLDGPGPTPPQLLMGVGADSVGTEFVQMGVRFDGQAYHNMPTAKYVDFGGSLIPARPQHFAAGRFGGTGAQRVFAATTPGVMEWDGTSFTMLAEADWDVQRVAFYNDGDGDALFALGRYATINAQPIANCAKYDGVSWTDASAGLPAGNFTYWQSLVCDFGAGPELVVSGFQFDVFPNTTKLFRRRAGVWTEVSLAALAPSGASINRMAFFNNRLYLCGNFSSVNAVASRGLAVFDGTTLLPFANCEPSTSRVIGVGVHNDGSGTALYISGNFTAIDGVAFDSLVKYDGSGFSQVPGITRNLYAEEIVSVDEPTGPALYLTGGLDTFIDEVNGRVSMGIACLKTPCPSCPADFNRSGSVTVQDIFDFLASWFASDQAADFNASGSVTVQDIFDFLAAWFAGCP